jgi:hypothetical protein
LIEEVGTMEKCTSYFYSDSERRKPAGAHFFFSNSFADHESIILMHLGKKFLIPTYDDSGISL